MKRWDEINEEEVRPAHREAVRDAVAEHLKSNRPQKQWQYWLYPVMGLGLLSLFFFRFREEKPSDSEVNLTFLSEDPEMITESEMLLDLDILEELDVLEAWEEENHG